MDKVTKSRAKLVLSYPFFGSLILRMDLIETKAVPTFGTDGRSIYYNADFADKLSVEEITGVLAHEGYHVALLHNLRIGNRQHNAWNAACDFAINPLLIEQGFKLPDNIEMKKGHSLKICNDEKYAGKSAEEIYELLPKVYVSFSGMGDVSQPKDGQGRPLIESEMKEIEFWQKTNIAKAAHIAKMAGKIPAGLDRLIKDILEPKVRWEDLIRKFFSQFIPVDHTWTKPSRRYISSGLYLPGVKKDGIGDIVFAVDTSGSVDDKMLAQFQAEVRSCLNQFGFKRCYILFCDTQVHAQIVENSEDITFQAKGGGGTDFRPPFDWVEKNEVKPECLIYLTDMECSSFPNEPEYPVMWVQAGGAEGKPPFGDYVRIE